MSLIQGGVDALGGDMMCAILAEIRFRLPVAAMDATGMYGHAFVNGGNAALLSGTGRPLQQTLADFAKVHRTWRWSAVRRSLSPLLCAFLLSSLGAAPLSMTASARLPLTCCTFIAS